MDYSTARSHCRNKSLLIFMPGLWENRCKRLILFRRQNTVVYQNKMCAWEEKNPSLPRVVLFAKHEIERATEWRGCVCVGRNAKRGKDGRRDGKGIQDMMMVWWSWWCVCKKGTASLPQRSFLGMDVSQQKFYNSMNLFGETEQCQGLARLGTGWVPRPSPTSTRPTPKDLQQSQHPICKLQHPSEDLFEDLYHHWRVPREDGGSPANKVGSTRRGSQMSLLAETLTWAASPHILLASQ